MRHGWTGGQYSALRAVTGAYLALLFAVRGEGPAAILAAVAALALAVGAFPRLAAGVALVSWAWSASSGTGLAEALAPLFLLGLHVLVPGTPYGAWSARGRVNPAGGWQLPPAWLLLARLVLGLLLLSQLAQAARGDSSALGALWVAGLLVSILHLVAPNWLPGRFPGDVDHVFYDGHCGLCHRTVRFLLAEDTSGCAFRFAPLSGPTFSAAIPSDQRAALPDSLVLVRPDGTRLLRSRGALHMLGRLGGLWRVVAAVGSTFPSGLADAVYDGVASVRHHVFTRPANACPLIPPELADRFDP